MIIGWNIWMLLQSESKIATFWIWQDATFFGISRFLFYNFLLIDATDRSKNSSNHHRIFFDVSLYPLLFFATLPLRDSQDVESHARFTLVPFKPSSSAEELQRYYKDSFPAENKVHTGNFLENDFCPPPFIKKCTWNFFMSYYK